MPLTAGSPYELDLATIEMAYLRTSLRRLWSTVRRYQRANWQHFARGEPAAYYRAIMLTVRHLDSLQRASDILSIAEGRPSLREVVRRNLGKSPELFDIFLDGISWR